MTAVQRHRQIVDDIAGRMYRGWFPGGVSWLLLGRRQKIAWLRRATEVLTWTSMHMTRGTVLKAIHDERCGTGVPCDGRCQEIADNVVFHLHLMLRGPESVAADRRRR